jgi:hypothetical protein
MRRSNWTPSIVPKSDDQTVYLVVDDFGPQSAEGKVRHPFFKGIREDL